MPNYRDLREVVCKIDQTFHVCLVKFGTQNFRDLIGSKIFSYSK